MRYTSLLVSSYPMKSSLLETPAAILLMVESNATSTCPFTEEMCSVAVISSAVDGVTCSTYALMIEVTRCGCGCASVRVDLGILVGLARVGLLGDNGNRYRGLLISTGACVGLKGHGDMVFGKGFDLVL